MTPFPGINGTHWGQEDCLFLDVYVPEGIRRGDKVPVIHWIYGSAFAFGSKDLIYTTLPPWGLFDAAALQSRKFIFVASNYR
jgi:carboxylesterase type B